MNYTATIRTTSDKDIVFYYKNYGNLAQILHRLDGPAIYQISADSGIYYIEGNLIGSHPQDKENYEKEVEKYIKEQIFQ